MGGELDDAGLRRLAEVFRQDARWVFSILRRFGVGAGDADDVTQEVFLVLRAHLAEVTPGEERRFLFRTAAYLAANARRAGRRRALPLPNATHEPISNRNAERELAERDELELLQEILDAMSDDLRAAFVLFEIEEMTVTEIAEILAIPLGTVKSRLLRARRVFEREAKRRGMGHESTGAAARRTS
jgi:RNA polymerase sigma-70 factor, ECF subfamily